jgi:Undecaprenyl-phosphate glucose phosphotransferase
LIAKGCKMADGLTNFGVNNSSSDRMNNTAEPVANTGDNDNIATPQSVDILTSSSPLKAYVLQRVARLADNIVIAVCALVSLQNLTGTILGASVSQALPFALLILAVSGGLKVAGAYRFGYSGSILTHLRRIMIGAALPAFVVVLIAIAFSAPSVSHWVVMAALASCVSTLVLHVHFTALFRGLKRAGWLSENVVIVGATDKARRLILQNEETHDLNIVGIFDDRLSRAPDDMAGAPLLGRIDDLLDWDKLPQVDKIIVTVTTDAKERIQFLVSRLRTLPQQVILLFDMDGLQVETNRLSRIADAPGAYVSGAPNDMRRAVWKRALDLSCAAALLLAFSPFMLAIAIAIKMDSPGPVFFRQKRHGFNNQVIRVWKFRSMIDNKAAEERMRSQTCADDPRVTRIGNFIRRTSLDELPQLLNVLIGEMSLVGPRPHAIGMTTDEREVHSIVSDYAHRHRVKPGITGWAQINGSRGPVHTQEEVQDRVRLDMEYINRSSVWFDLYIMVMTAPCLLGDAKRDR